MTATGPHRSPRPGRDPRRPGPGAQGIVRDWPWAWILPLVVFAALLLFALRAPLAEFLWPRSRADTLLVAAGEALARGRLTATDGTGARELFEAAQALDPDDIEPRVGLAHVARAAVAQARGAIERGDHAAAHRALALARALDAPRGAVDDTAEALRLREALGADIDALLARAARARAAGDLEGGAGSALPLYARVLALQPAHATALAGREDAVADLLERSRDAAVRGRVAEAVDHLRRARGFDAAHPDLPDTQATLAAALEGRRAAADAAMDAGHLDAALFAYREVLFADPDDGHAITGLARVAAAWAGRASRLAADFRFAPAVEALDKAREVDAEAPEVARATEDLRQARAAHARLRPAGALPTAQGQARLGRVLEGIEGAASRNEWLAPPGDSAYDRLRVARTLAPDDPRVERAGGRLRELAATCFVDSLRANRLARAGECLSLRTELGDDPSRLAADRRVLASRWIAHGGERLGAGELDNARRALERARALDPDAPGLREFAGRLDRAQAAIGRNR